MDYSPLHQQSQKGVSLVIAFFVMTILLSIVLSISIIAYNQLRIVGSIGNSVSAFYAAESGAEKALYYDRKHIPNSGYRGLCNIASSCPGCADVVTTGTSCTAQNCADCQITFNSIFDGKSFEVTATLGPDAQDPTLSFLELNSRGSYQETQRAIILESKGYRYPDCELDAQGPFTPLSGTVAVSDGDSVKIIFSCGLPNGLNEFGYYFDSAPQNQIVLGSVPGTLPGTEFNVNVPAGASEMVIFIDTVQNNTWVNGPGSRNSNGQIQADVRSISSTIRRISFEDYDISLITEPGEPDFNDAVFNVIVIPQ